MSALAYIVNVVFDLYILVLVVRLLMQKFNANFHNPFSRFIITVTEPVVKPLRRFLPTVAGYDLAVVMAMFLFELIELYITVPLEFAIVPGIFGAVLLTIGALCLKLINVFFWTTIIAVLISWVPALRNNPFADIIILLAEPVMGPARRYIPAMGGLDLSPLVVLIALQVIALFVINPFITVATRLAL